VHAEYGSISFVREYYFKRKAKLLRKPHLVAPIFPHIPPTRFILGSLQECTEKPLFLLRALPQKNSDFVVLIADEVNLELVEWCPSAQELYPIGAKGHHLAHQGHAYANR